MTPHRAVRFAVATAAVLTAMTGCVPVGRPSDNVLSSPDGLSTRWATELLDEALLQTDELVQLIGGEWLDAGSPPSVFDPTSRAGWSMQACDMPATSEQYSINLWQDPPPGTELDPFSHVAKVRAHWESLGYTIRQIGPPEQDITHGHSIIVDFRNKAGLSFFASTEVLAISVQSECTAISR